MAAAIEPSLEFVTKSISVYSIKKIVDFKKKHIYYKLFTFLRYKKTHQQGETPFEWQKGVLRGLKIILGLSMSIFSRIYI